MDVNRRLLRAAIYGNLETARELINTYGLSYSKSWSNGYVLLNLALENGHADVAELLLSKGSKVNSKTSIIIESNTPLHFAASQGNIKIVEMILNKNARIDAINQDRRTPLVEAIVESRLKATELLLKHGANVNIDCYGQSPLHCAIECIQQNCYDQSPHNRSRIKCIQQKIIMMLLKKGAAVNAKGTDGSTPLHLALGYVDKEIVITLLTKGADVNAKSNDGHTPLHLAIHGHHEITTLLEIVELLLQHGAKVDIQDKDGKTILYLAVEKGYLTVVETVLKYFPDINNPSNRSSIYAAILGNGDEHGKIFDALLKYGFNINPEDTISPELIHKAVEKGYLKIVEGFFKYGVDVDIRDSKYGFTPLQIAVTNQQIELVKLLISFDADINASNKEGITALHFTALGDKERKTALHFTDLGSRMRSLESNKNHDTIIKGEIAKLLLSKGANVDALAKNGDTTLHHASRSGCASVVEALLEYNASVNAVNMFGITPLDLAVEKGDQEIITMLLTKGADINAKQKDGTTPLHLAAQNGYQEIIKMLLTKGANVNAKQKNGRTSLHLAAQYCPHDIIETILNFGADINSRDQDRRTAFYFAFENRDVKMVETLLEFGCEIDGVDCTSMFEFSYDNTYLERDSYYDSDTYYSGHSYFDRYKCRERNKVTAVRHYIVKMLAANLYVSKKTLNLVGEGIIHKMYDLHCECKEEIANMKSEKINYTNISFYDILANTTSSLANYMRNQNVVQVSKSDYDTKFPKYGRMIKCNFKKGMERKELLEQNNQIFNFFNNNLVELPRECTEKIFSYLSNYDMRILIDVFKPLSNSSPNVDNE